MPGSSGVAHCAQDPLAMTPTRIDILMVTYGNRWPLLRGTLEALHGMPEVRQVTLIDNGSIYNIAEQLATIPTPAINLILMPENMGSAFAIGTGLQQLRADAQTECILLLDDDNVPAPDCLKQLLSAWSTLSARHTPDALMLQCMRPARTYLRHAAKGVHPELFFPLPDHFLGFHVFRPDIRFRRRQIVKSIRNTDDRDHVSIPCAPYGGLFLHRAALDKIGVPDAQLHTYADDFEFTLRFTRGGGHLYLIPPAVVEDSEPTLVNTRKAGWFSSKFFAMPDRRLFLLMRNTAYYTERALVRHAAIYHLNRVLYTTYLFLSALLHGRMGSFKIFNFAIRQGRRGIMRHADIPK